MLSNVTDKITSFLVINECSYRNFKNKVLAIWPIHIGAQAFMTIFGLKDFLTSEMHQSIKTLISFKNDGATISAITTIGTAHGNIFFAAKTYTAFSTVTGNNFNINFRSEERRVGKEC